MSLPGKRWWIWTENENKFWKEFLLKFLLNTLLNNEIAVSLTLDASLLIPSSTIDVPWTLGLRILSIAGAVHWMWNEMTQHSTSVICKTLRCTWNWLLSMQLVGVRMLLRWVTYGWLLSVAGIDRFTNMMLFKNSTDFNSILSLSLRFLDKFFKTHHLIPILSLYRGDRASSLIYSVNMLPPTFSGLTEKQSHVNGKPR